MDPETRFALLVASAGLPDPEREYRILPGRRFRADFAWPVSRLFVEIEGGVWVRGRHTRPVGYARDCEKYSLASLAGWRVVRLTPDMITAEWVERIREAL